MLISEAEWRPEVLAELNQSERSLPVKACGRYPDISTLTPFFYYPLFSVFPLSLVGVFVIECECEDPPNVHNEQHNIQI